MIRTVTQTVSRLLFFLAAARTTARARARVVSGTARSRAGATTGARVRSRAAHIFVAVFLHVQFHGAVVHFHALQVFKRAVEFIASRKASFSAPSSGTRVSIDVRYFACFAHQIFQLGPIATGGQIVHSESELGSVGTRPIASSSSISSSTSTATS